MYMFVPVNQFSVILGRLFGFNKCEATGIEFLPISP